MNKMKFESPNLTADNIAKLSELFPGVVAEGKVNIDLLRSYVGEEVFGDEAYEFTWVGKRAAIAEAGRPIRKTLRPCVEESRNWDTTENLYIEGDNLDVLKLLQESYLGKVKMIYIDPPYNTGKNYIYRNDFSIDTVDYLDESGEVDEEGARLVANPQTYARFHSAWLTMMYQRLILARNLLAKDGVMIVAIDENEQATLSLLLKEVFGGGGYEQVCVSVVHNPGGTQGNNFSFTHEYAIFVFPKGDRLIQLQNRTENPDIRPLRDVSKGNHLRVDAKNCFYPILVKDGEIIGFGDVCDDSYHPESANVKREDGVTEIYPIDASGNERKWVWARQSVETIRHELRVVENKKRGILDIERVKTHFNYKTVWTDDKYNANSYGTKLLAKLMPNCGFDFPKSLYTVLECVKAVVLNVPDAIVLDFFSGSGTTAHAVMQLNAEDGGKRRFIAVQLNEDLDKSIENAVGETKKSLQQSIRFLDSINKPHFLTEIGKERIRRAGNKIKADNADKEGIENLDIGFRVLKLDDTNMSNVYYAANDYTQELVLNLESNIKPGRTDMDLLFGCLLDWGLPLSMPHSHEKIDGFTIHTYNDGDLIACFDELISEAAIREIAARCGSEARKGLATRAVFRDSSFTSSPEKINVFEIFKLLAPNSTVRVI